VQPRHEAGRRIGAQEQAAPPKPTPTPPFPAEGGMAAERGRKRTTSR